MEFEQIVKRLDFLEKQQRQNKETIAALTERLASFQTDVNAVAKQIKPLAKQVADLTPLAKRVDQFETLVTKQRTEITKLIEESDKKHERVEREAAKTAQGDVLELQKSIQALKTATNLTDIKKQIKSNGDEIQRILFNVSDLKSAVEDAKRSTEDVQHALKAGEETRKNDLKRVTDLQGELTAVRKRIDENREKNIINADHVRNVENRFAELLNSELERKQAQAAFLEQQSLAQIERDRGWKEWREKVEEFQKEASGIGAQIERLDDAMRGAKKAQETYVELNTKLERRISEVTEMQRLTEDRLRQEWVSFKADDQKRWTGYSLSSEESFREIRREVSKYEERIAALQEISQILQDQIHQTTDAAEQQLQEMMNVVHEWMTSYQRIMGHGKKTGKK
jgi:chromosome segregation ATPase